MPRSSRYVSRHAAPESRSRRPVRRWSDEGHRTALKSVAGIGLLVGSGALAVAPSSAAESEPSAASQAVPAAFVAAERETEAASRTAARPAITAPKSTAATAAEIDVLELTAVAKPKPAPKPAPAPTTEQGDETSAASPSPTAQPSAEADSSSEAPTEAGASSSSSTGGAPVTSGFAAEAQGMGLGPNAQGVYSAVRTQFPSASNIGGYRAGDSGDHGSGRAVDIMVTGAAGDEIAAWLQQHAGELNITYIIWQQRIWMPGNGAWKPMADRGSVTENHFDHVHVSVS